jgi:outer membrane protein assembly factor BamB
MQAQTASIPSDQTPYQAAPAGSKRLRLWPALVLIAVFWAAYFVVGALEKPYFVAWIYSMAAPALLLLLFSIWWWVFARLSLAYRVYGCALVVVAGAVVTPLCHPTIWFGLPTGGLAMALTVVTLWLLFVNWTGFPWNQLGLAVVVLLSWGYFTLIRVDGINGDLKANTKWRWTPTPEQQFLAEKARRQGSNADLGDSGQVLSLTAGDWPAFRGPDRDGVIRGVRIATDWDATPPKLLWRQLVGPAWSSVIVVGRRLYTQEQRGDKEAVVCYEAATGKELWAHEDDGRFDGPPAGVGPRATPTFADGKLFSLGASGVLNCLNARTGERLWQHDISADAPAKPPMWGFSGSPLVVKDKVIVFAGGQSGRQLLAYDTQSGNLAWTAPASDGSYASPQLVTLAGQPQCLLPGDQGVTAVDPATGNVLWRYGRPTPGAPRALQVHLVGQSQLIGTLALTGLTLIDVTRQDGQWQATEVWSSWQMRPEFSDIVVHEGRAYGFDGAIFSCIDLSAGKRRWKEGRYGRGQVMLLAEQALLLVLTEEGEVVLLPADGYRHEELGRFRALEGTTWNHPVIAHGRLFVRNAEEMACYELAGP